MASKGKKTALAGSEHAPVEGARVAGRPHPQETAQVTVYVRPRSGELPSADELAQPGRRQLSHKAFKARHSALRKDLSKVTAFARAHGLKVVESHASRRVVKLSGTIEALNEAFGVELAHYEHADGCYRGHEGPVHLPKELQGVVTSVLGLDDRPLARPHVVRPQAEAAATIQPKAAGAQGFTGIPPGLFTPPQVAQAYRFPAGTDGAGQCIGIIELGGGFRQSDLTTYFKTLGIPQPDISTYGPNKPGSIPDDDIEVALDLEVVGSVAPGAKIVVYFAEQGSSQGFVNVVNEAIHDTVHRPSVLSISWGNPEVTWPAMAAAEMNRVMLSGSLLGVTIFCASGDSGAANRLPGGRIAATFPASAPGAIGCGGTRLAASGDVIENEIVWNNLAEGGGASGGGVSIYFSRPAYQLRAAVPPVPPAGFRAGFWGRGVPDVAGNADPQSGYVILVNGRWQPSGGTSAVAPLWAALTARLNQALDRRVGFLSTALYALEGTPVFRQILVGNNGYYPAGPGWNACTGLGSPDGTLLLAALQQMAAS